MSVTHRLWQIADVTQNNNVVVIKLGKVVRSHVYIEVDSIMVAFNIMHITSM